MADASYAAAVQDSFVTKPLRTVLMIDDAFPTFADLCSENTGKEKADKDRALSLYSGFRARNMLCDIENDVADVDADHLRKSDLVVLDYHLTPGSTDSTKSIQLLRSLASSKHFNTIVVYTAEDDQNKVWLDVIASLSGGWSAVTAGLDGEPKQEWERLADEKKLPESPSLDAIMQYARSGDVRGIETAILTAARQELIDAGAASQHSTKILEYLLAEQLSIIAGDYAALPSGHAVGNYQNGKRWVQVGNAFVVIMEKIKDTEGDAETAAIMKALCDALIDWHPNIVQILISEIQNALELDGVASDDTILRRPDTQAALTFYLLDNVGKFDVAKDNNLKAALMGLVDKMVDGMRRKLSSHESLLDLAQGALAGDLRDTGWTAETWPAANTAAVTLARVSVKPPRMLFRLNNFMSTERFGRAHLTTGTVFRDPANSQYFVVTSPACDMVARDPNVVQAWATAINPLKPMMALLLDPAADMNKALTAAANGEHVFLECDGEPKAFKVVIGVGHQPSYEFFFVHEQGRVYDEGGKKVFSASRLSAHQPTSIAPLPETAPAEVPANDVTPPDVAAPAAVKATPAEQSPAIENMTYGYFEVVDQLRAVNATHLLQLAGQHLSRVGLDFISG